MPSQSPPPEPPCPKPPPAYPHPDQTMLQLFTTDSPLYWLQKELNQPNQPKVQPSQNSSKFLYQQPLESCKKEHFDKEQAIKILNKKVAEKTTQKVLNYKPEERLYALENEEEKESEPIMIKQRAKKAVDPQWLRHLEFCPDLVKDSSLFLEDEKKEEEPFDFWIQSEYIEPPKYSLDFSLEELNFDDSRRLKFLS